MGHDGVSEAEYTDTWAAAAKDVLWFPAEKRYGRAAAASAAEKCEGLRADFEAARGQMEREAHRAAKLEKKAGIVITVRRAAGVGSSLYRGGWLDVDRGRAV